jgi:D-glycero-alpha-D-manno-heptose-7-phosphate kinase
MRIDLAGGWTDVPAYAAKHGGAVVNVAITLYAHAAVSRGGRGVSLRALDLGTALSAQRIEDLRADGELALVKAVARKLAPSGGGIEIVTRSDAPAGSGLGGSGALGVALVAAMDKLTGQTRMPAEVAGAAFEIETIEAGIVGGSQDQYAAAMGGFQFLSFGEPSVTSMRPDVPAACRRELEQSLVLCYTGATRFSSETHHRVWGAFDRGEKPTRVALDGLRACGTAMRAALVAGDVAQVADVLNENWRHQRALAEGMETDAMRRLGEIGFAAGADGMKACGAGAGGCIVLLAKPGREFDVSEALKAAGGTVLRFGFDNGGVTVWEAQER